ncbi:hypothetical protein K435DRAFT_817067 [Dendrothele bispora CBS 962.96]|uniref:Uncharacterized protein n=1 Tax=Dendrothele bispora (strain CBS 962.96) TaxID=1314807 RepID=A0A4S8MM64_DENBC|nr:hypothetical protein K435DRAFT_817067 [Dendrothele bispora CBS 962.96]
MPPLFAVVRATRSLSPLDGFIRRREPSQDLRFTWQNPSDTLSILLIIGGDVVLQALAQLSGHKLVPVAFSFGWVAYSFNTLKALVGDGRLMPPPDYPTRAINAENGYGRDNKSWVLGRLARDFEYPLPDDVGLSVTVFEAAQGEIAGVPSIDWFWISGFIVIILQLGIAVIPWKTSQDWGIFVMTASGTALSLFTGMLPQWSSEKWAARRSSKKAVCLTGGNGKRHVMVIIGNGCGLDLEDLAAAETAFWFTQLICSIMALLWIIFLINVTALKENAWYLLAVGSVGMIQNVIVAGARREIGTSGIHLERIEEFRQEKVMDVLMDVECAYKSVGKSLVAEFFPSDLRPAEDLWWSGNKESYEKNRKKNRPGSKKLYEGEAQGHRSTMSCFSQSTREKEKKEFENEGTLGEEHGIAEQAERK